MKNSKGNISGFATEQMPNNEQIVEKLLNDLKYSGRSDIKFLVKNMKIKEPVDMREIGISFKLDAHQNTIGVLKLDVLDIDHVRQAYDKIDETVTILSFLYGVGDWELKMRMTPTARFTSACVLERKDFRSVDDALSSMSDNLNKQEKEIYFRALEWYRYGINSKNPFNRFLAFYNSIEVFSDGYYYKKHKTEIRKQKPEKDECIKKYFEDLSIMSISEIEREHINNCYEECLKTSIKDKMMFAFKKVFNGNKDKISEFSKKFLEENGNFASIRNDIAHGNLSEYREDDRTLVEKNLRDIHFMAQEFLIEIIP